MVWNEWFEFGSDDYWYHVTDIVIVPRDVVLENWKARMKIPCMQKRIIVVNNMIIVRRELPGLLENLNCTISIRILSVCVNAMQISFSAWKMMEVGWVWRLDRCILMYWICLVSNWMWARFASKKLFGENVSKKLKDKLQNLKKHRNFDYQNAVITFFEMNDLYPDRMIGN